MASAPIDVNRVRADTPGTQNLIHFSNAGSSLPPQQVLDVQVDYLRLEASVGGYEAYASRLNDMDAFYSTAGELLGSHSSEIALTRGASESWWRAFLAVPLQAGDTVLAGTSEFVSGALGLIQARNAGIDVQMVPDGPDGIIDLEALESMLDERVKLVCLTYLPMSNGLINPAAAVGQMVKDSNALYLLDACQAVGQMPVDVEDLQCDFLTATGRKWLRAMRGTGLLYVRETVLGQLNDPIMIDGASADWFDTEAYTLKPGAKRYELAEISYAGKLGLATAMRYALDLGLDAIADRVGSLADALRTQLAPIPNVTVHDVGAVKSGICTFTVADHQHTAIANQLRQAGVNVSAPPISSSRTDVTRTGVPGIIRASPHYYNTEDEIDQMTAKLNTIVNG
jgi:cysteine desulfurase/selenocysteine lyase